METFWSCRDVAKSVPALASPQGQSCSVFASRHGNGLRARPRHKHPGKHARKAIKADDHPMKLSPRSRRIALLAFMAALVAILVVGFYRAAVHEEPRPVTAPASSASSPMPH